MPASILVNYRLSRDLWHQFFDAHYGCDRNLKLRYLWGAVCILIGAAGFGGLYASPVVAALLLTTGFYGVLSKHLLIHKSLRGAVRHPFFGKELSVAISAAEIAVRSGNSGYSQGWENFAGYRELAPGFLLYHDRNAFFFIPRSALSPGQAGQLGQILDAAGVTNLASG